MRFVRFRAYPKKCGTGLQPVYFTQIEAHQVVAAGARRTAGTTAIVVVARRMLEDAFTLLKRDEAFRTSPRCERAPRTTPTRTSPDNPLPSSWAGPVARS